eukprot:TRINITY_DN19544_c0_g1_i1.p1 TRINITY_DN19544_c0_g1~~TRINITY_DN19544_c0_g1_i1.p1  ORF type:complete len:549 (+),score=102.72 TRINITY_DN19544_c0_g1_i1:175-1821(+)
MTSIQSQPRAGSCLLTAGSMPLTCRPLAIGYKETGKNVLYNRKWRSGSVIRGKQIGGTCFWIFRPRLLRRRSYLASSTGDGSHEDTYVRAEADSSKKYFKWPHSKRPRICILGGGFGGLYTALRLESLMWPSEKKPQVLLVDQSDRFVYKPMLYDFLTGDVDAWEIAPYFRDLLSNTSVQHLKDKVNAIYPSNISGYHRLSASRNAGTVLLESGLHVEYDWLVLGLGAVSKLDTVPGASEFALPFSTFEDAVKLKQQLSVLERRFSMDQSPICISVVGCGYCGVELAATLAEILQHRGKVQVINVERAICPTAPNANREAALKVLISRNVELSLGYFVKGVGKVRKFDETGISNMPNKDGYTLDLQPTERGFPCQTLVSDLVLWTIGAKPNVPPTISSSYSNSLPVNFKGQVEIEETLQVMGYNHIFAIGDIAGLRDASGKALPMTAQVATQQADFAAWNLWAAINKRPLLPFRFQYLGEMMTLGKKDAVCKVNLPDTFILEGPAATALRKLAYWYRMPTDEQRIKVGFSWLAKSTIDSIASLQGLIP